jgi:S-DNA-T family DNA segregation ATPase FtsK/SpoIIIE
MLMPIAMTPSREFLNFQADRIEHVLASHRVPVRVHGGSVTPRWIRFLLTPAVGAKIATVRNLSEELALALGAQEVRVARDGESLAVEVPRPDPEPVRLLPLLRSLTSLPPITACLGLTDDGRPLLLRLPSPEVAHVLVCGTTGSGKTELMRAMLLSLALTNRQSKLQLALIDPKSRGFMPLAGLPHVIDDIASDAASALTLLDKLIVEMERRDAEGISSPHIVVAVDEMLDLLVVGGKPVEAALTRISQRGREAGMHLIAGAQKPSSSALGPMLKANFPVRLVGRVGSAEDARVASGQAGTGAEKLLGRGDFLAVTAGQTLRFQAAWIPAADWPHLMAGL